MTPNLFNYSLVTQYWYKITLKDLFDPKYIGDYHVVSIKGNQIEVRPSIGGPTEMKHVKHVKYVLLADQYIKYVPDYSTFGRKLH